MRARFAWSATSSEALRENASPLDEMAALTKDGLRGAQEGCGGVFNAEIMGIMARRALHFGAANIGRVKANIHETSWRPQEAVQIIPVSDGNGMPGGKIRPHDSAALDESGLGADAPLGLGIVLLTAPGRGGVKSAHRHGAVMAG